MPQAGVNTISVLARSARSGRRLDVSQLVREARTARSALPAHDHHQGKQVREAVAAVRPAPARSPRGRAAHHQVASGKAVAKCGIM